jgi:hypothetical protein
LPILKRFRGRAVRQSSAKASTAVRICSEPLIYLHFILATLHKKIKKAT